MTIGPQLPPHLAQSRQPDADADADAGPAAPSRDDDEDDDDDFGPALPPDLQQDRERSSRAEQTPTAVAGPQLPPHLTRSTPAVSGPSMPTLGPTLPPAGAAGLSRPSYGTAEDGEDDSDGEVGPLPPPVGQQVDDDAGVRLFREREERERRKQQEEAENKKPKREEWMLVPPKEMDLLSCEFLSTPASSRTNSSSRHWLTPRPTFRSHRYDKTQVARFRHGQGSSARVRQRQLVRRQPVDGNAGRTTGTAARRDARQEAESGERSGRRRDRRSAPEEAEGSAAQG